jgi:hypothetical protein
MTGEAICPVLNWQMLFAVPMTLPRTVGGGPGVMCDAAPEARRRLLVYLLQSFAAAAARPLPDPPSKGQMYRALMRLPKTPQQEHDTRLGATDAVAANGSRPQPPSGS